MKNLPVRHAVRFIEPGPILLVTTQGSDGPNVMTMGFHMMMQHDPPLIGCIIGPWNDGQAALRMTGECVLAVPGSALARRVVDIGNCSGADMDKFATFNLHTHAGHKVTAPLLTDCIANLECKLVDGAQSERSNLHILEVVKLWVSPSWQKRRTLHHLGNGCFREDRQSIDHSDGMTKRRHLAL